MTVQWVYQQHNGALISPTGEMVYHGYSGAGKFKNDPSAEGRVAQGPIPRGLWSIDPVARSSPHTGPYTITLNPVGHDALGRSEFRIHGDSRTNPGTASHGCIVMPRGVREQMIASKVYLLNVTI